MKSIPEINGLPFLGNFLEYRRNKISFLSSLRDANDDQVWFRLGSHPLLLITNPEDIHWVEAKNAKNYVKATNLRELVGDGILMSEGEKWRKQRRLIQPTFHQGTILKMVDAMNRRIGGFVDEINHEIVLKGDGVIDLGFKLKKLVFEIVGEAVFGSEVGSQFDRLRESMEYINVFLTQRFHQLVTVPLHFPTPSNLKFHKAKRIIDQTIFDVILKKRAELDAGKENEDIITKMMIARDPETGESMSLHQLRDEVASMMLAGFETTGLLLPWILHLVSNDSEVQKDLHSEIDQVLGRRVPNGGDTFQLPFLNNVVDETLRLYPPVWAWTKRAIHSDELRGSSIKAGSILFISPYLVHRHPNIWESPNDFKPSRWTSELRERTKLSFFPFGMGPRTCVGKHLALMEVKLILIHFFQSFLVAPCGDLEVKPDFQVTLGMKESLRLKISRRRS
jgi:cytochrome P450